MKPFLLTPIVLKIPPHNDGTSCHRHHATWMHWRSGVVHRYTATPHLIDANSISLMDAGKAWRRCTCRDGTKSGPSLGSPSIQFRPAEMLSRSCSGPAGPYKADLRACTNTLQAL